MGRIALRYFVPGFQCAEQPNLTLPQIGSSMIGDCRNVSVITLRYNMGAWQNE
jgi:hypothetical protein